MDIATYLFKNKIKKKRMAEDLDLTATYISALCLRTYQPSIKLAKQIILWSRGDIRPCDLYPELYESLREAKRNEKD